MTTTLQAPTDIEPVEILVDDLVIEPDLNLRDRLNDEILQRYAESWTYLPPVTVFDVEGQYLMVDGFHRHGAAQILGKTTLPAWILSGTYHEALDYAAGANMFHGLALSREERRRAIEIRLKLHPDWSDRRLAESLGVGRETVAKLRRALVEANQIPDAATRIGSDGKEYPAYVGLPRDPTLEQPADGPAIAQMDPAGSATINRDDPPWDDSETRDDEPPRGERPPNQPAFDGSADHKALALADPPTPAAPTIEEMVDLMARQINEVIAWTQTDGFDAAYFQADQSVRRQFHRAVHELSRVADRLEPRGS